MAWHDNLTRWFDRFTPPMAVQLTYDAIRCLWIDEGPDKTSCIHHVAEALLPNHCYDVNPGRIEILETETVLDRLRSVLPEGPRPHRVTLAIPDASGIYFQLDVEDWPKRSQAQADLVQWHVQQQLPHPLDQYRLTWQHLGSQGTSKKVAVLAAWAPFLDQIEDLSHKVDLSPGKILPESFFIENMILDGVLETEPQTEPQLLVHWDVERMTVSSFENRNLLFKRTRTLGLEEDWEARTATLQREIRLVWVYITDYYRDRIPGRMILNGPGSDQIADDLRAWEGLHPVDLAELWPEDRWCGLEDRSNPWFPLLAALSKGRRS